MHEHLFVAIYLFVWTFTGFIIHEDESKHGNIREVNEDHDDNDDKKFLLRTMMKIMMAMMMLMA